MTFPQAAATRQHHALRRATRLRLAARRPATAAGDHSRLARRCSTAWIDRRIRPCGISPWHPTSPQIRCPQSSSDTPRLHEMARMYRLVALLGLVFWATVASADVQHNKWCQITTPDFQLVSDLWPRDALALARTMTNFKLAVQALTRERLEGPPLTIIAFRRARASRRVFTTPNIDGSGILLRERSTLAFVYGNGHQRRGEAQERISRIRPLPAALPPRPRLPGVV